MQRAMNTGKADDVALVSGNVYEAGSMEELTGLRGGIWEDTPVVVLP
jgi:hypothetical protein